MFNEYDGISKVKFSQTRITRINKFLGFKKSILIDETIKNLQGTVFNYKNLIYLAKYENGTIRFSAL